MNKTEKRWRSYLMVEFPDKFTEEQIRATKATLQEILDRNNRGVVIKKVDFISNTN
jgi:hypothetical protein